MKRRFTYSHLVLLALSCASNGPGLTAVYAQAPTQKPDSAAGSAPQSAAAAPRSDSASTAATAPVESISVYVLGAVARPGLVKLPNNPQKKPRLLDAIRAAGGLRLAEPQPAKVSPPTTPEPEKAAASSPAPTQETAQKTENTTKVAGVTARLLRSDGPRTIELFGLREGNVTGNVSLREGDVIVVAQDDVQMISAAGAVLHAGKYVLKPRSAAAFLKMVGIAENAALKDAYIQRGSERIAIDGEALADGRAQGPMLKAGDILQIPAGLGLVEVRGAVRFPGVRTYRKAMGLLDAVGLCGGWGNLADVNALPQVLTPIPVAAPELNLAVSTKNRDLPLSIFSVFRNEEFGARTPLSPGQHLRIPERERVTVLGAKRSPHYVLPGPSLLAALTAAGDTPADADLAHIVIMGGVGRARGIVTGLHSTEKLLRGDIVWVARHGSIAVSGAVIKPQNMAWQTGSTLMEAIKAAGGSSPLAAADAVAVLRPQEGQLVMLKADLNKASAGEAAQNLTLQAGDIIVVPFREKLSEGSAQRSPITLTPLLSFLVAPPSR